LAQNINLSIHASKMLDKEFYMRNLHFRLDKPNKPIFHKNFDVFFYAYIYTHASNTLLINDTPYKKHVQWFVYCLFFWSPLMAIVGRISIWLGLFSFTWKTFICSNKVFPPLLNTFPLVGLDVLIEIIKDFFKCYFWNVVGFTNPLL